MGRMLNIIRITHAPAASSTVARDPGCRAYTKLIQGSGLIQAEKTTDILSRRALHEEPQRYRRKKFEAAQYFAISFAEGRWGSHLMGRN